MKETVYKEDAIYAIKNMMGIARNEKIVTKESAMYALRALPSADRTGKWEEHVFDGMMGSRPRALMCNQCNSINIVKTDYCPNCGADMRGKQDGNV